MAGLNIRRGLGAKYKLLTTGIAVFALLVQPMYALVASHVANAATAVVTNQSELQAALGDASRDTIQLGASFSVDTKMSIARPLVFDGGGFTLSSTRNNNPNNNSNNAVLGIDNTSGVTVNNLTVTRGSALNIHGVNAWRAAATLNNVTITGFNNGGTKYGLIVGENSQVTANNLTTSGNSRGVNVDKGTPKLTVTGQSSHSEGYAIYTDQRNATYVDDVNGQYARSNVFLGGHRYTLKGAPVAPAITSPADGSTIVALSTVAAWSAVPGNASTQAAANYEYRLDEGVATTTADLTATLTGLTDGTHKLEVRAISATGLAGPWSAANFTVVSPVPDAPTDLKLVETASGNTINHLGYTNKAAVTASWNMPVGQAADSYEYVYWNDVASSPYTATNPWVQPTGAVNYPGTVNQGEGMHHWAVRAVKDGVKSDLSAVYSFTYDATAPKIENISLSPVINGNIGGTVVVEFDMTDISGVNLNRARTHVSFVDGPNDSNRAKESAKAEVVDIGGDRYRAVINTRDFVKDNWTGNYNLSISREDIVGNRSSIKPVEFRGILIDNSGPTSTWTTPNNGDRVNGVQRFSFEVSDHTGVKSGYVKLNGPTTKQVNLVQQGTTNVWYADIDTAELTDGTYTIDARFVDAFDRPRFGANKGAVVVDNTALMQVTPPASTPVEIPVISPDPSSGATAGQTPVNPALSVATPLVPFASASPLATALQGIFGDSSDSAADQAATIAPTPEVRGSETSVTTNTVSDGDVKAAQDSKTSWSVVNAALAAVALIAGLMALAGLFGKREEGESARVGLRTGAIVLAVAAAGTLWIVEDFTAPMAIANIWTIAFAAVAVAQVAIIATLKKSAE